MPVSEHDSLARRPTDGYIIGSDNVNEQLDVSVGQILGCHLLSFLSLGLQRSFGFGQLEKVYS